MRMLLLCVCLAMTGSTNSQGQETAQTPYVLSWKLIQNIPSGGYRAELALQNKSSTALSSPWELYFSSYIPLATESVKGPVKLVHVQGDIYRLLSSKDCPSIQQEESLSFKWSGIGHAINGCDGPSGAYLIRSGRDNNPAQPENVTVNIEPFPRNNLIHRGAEDRMPVVSDGMRFAENAKLLSVDPREVSLITPTPVHTERKAGYCEIDTSMPIFYDDGLENEAQLLRVFLSEHFTSDFKITKGTSAVGRAIRLRLGSVSVKGVERNPGAEAYTFTVSPETGIEIVGTDHAGVFYGIQSLRAVLPVDVYRKQIEHTTISAMHIEDAPRFQYRGLHLDVARNFQKIDTVKKLINVMAFYKMNRFHWHLTDDEGWRIEIQSLPELTLVGSRRGHTLDETDRLLPSFGSGADPNNPAGSGYYSQEQFVELLRYAKARHIAVIPEIDTPGHSRAAIKAMEARSRKLAATDPTHQPLDYLLTDPEDDSEYRSVQGWSDNVMDVRREPTYRFMEVVIEEITEMFRLADAPLLAIHLGGDEVPEGVWKKRGEKSSTAEATSRVHELQRHFLERSSRILAKFGIRSACWEDTLLFAAAHGGPAASLRPLDTPEQPIAYVWNNVWGWGREDAAYQLANNGFDVVLCNATHLYFDLAYEKHPLEPGAYWAGFIDVRDPYEFNPLNIFQNASHDILGRAIPDDRYANRSRLSDEGKPHILGIQGELWGENLRSPEAVEYLAFPRAISVAERAWSPAPSWANSDTSSANAKAIQEDWSRFASRLGHRELPRLDYFAGGVRYRIPPPGVQIKGDLVEANAAYPGLAIRYSLNGRPPTSASPLYEEPLSLTVPITFCTFDTRGRASRVVTVTASQTE